MMLSSHFPAINAMAPPARRERALYSLGLTPVTVRFIAANNRMVVVKSEARRGTFLPVGE